MANQYKPLWIDPFENILYAGWQNTQSAPSLVFKQGDKIDIELFLVKRGISSSSQEEVEFPAGSTIRFAVGKLDTPPTGGTLVISYEGEQTGNIAYNASASAIQTALNAVPTIASAGGVTVTLVSQTIFRIAFNTVGARSTPLLDTTGLTPTSSGRVITARVGTSTVSAIYIFRVNQSVAVFQNNWVDSQQPTITATTLVANQTKRVTISPIPLSGTWTLSTTPSIARLVEDAGDEDDVPTYWTQTVSSRLGAFTSSFLGEDGRPIWNMSVIQIGSTSWDFTVRNDYDVPVGYTMPFTVDGNFTKFPSKVSTVNFDTVEVEYLLDGAESVTASLEIEVESPSGDKWTVLQTSCTIVNDLIDQATYSPLVLETPLQDAPSDGSLYARQDGAWVSFTEEDNQGITQAEGDARYALTNTQNSFLQPQSIVPPSDSTSPALRITNTGTGEALRVEDESPETTPFVVGADGRVGIHGTPATNTLYKLAIYNGDVVFTNGYGVSFGDGTRLTTAPAVGNFVSEDDPRVLALSTDFIPQGVQSSVTVTVAYTDGSTGLDETSDIVITSPSGNYNGWSVVLTDSATAGTFSISGTTITIGCNASTMQDALYALSGSSMDGWTVAGSGSPYAPSSVLELTTTVVTPPTSPYTDSSVKFLLREGLFPEIARLAQVANVTNSLISVDSAGVVGFTDTYVDQSQLLPYALLSGANFTGKLTVSMSLSGSPVAQFDQTGSGGCVVIRSTSTTSPGHCLRIENRGTGSSLLVEDSVTPDTNAFIINNNGVVGIQRPTSWTPATGVFLDVGGKGVFTSVSGAAGLNIGIGGVQATANVPGDMWIATAGTVLNYRDANGAARIVAARNLVNTFTNAQIISIGDTNTALRITQTGTGNAFVVEDGSSTNPDTDSFVINNAGNVGIGVNPNTWTATEKFEVQGGIKFSDNSVQTTAYIPSNVAITGGTIDNVVIDGGTY